MPWAVPCNSSSVCRLGTSLVSKRISRKGVMARLKLQRICMGGDNHLCGALADVPGGGIVSEKMVSVPFY